MASTGFRWRDGDLLDHAGSVDQFTRGAIGIAVINATAILSLSPFMIGWLKDITGSFNSGLWFVASLLVVGAAIIGLFP